MYLCGMDLKIKDGFKGSSLLTIPPEMVQALAHDAIARTLYVTDIGFFPHAAHHFRERNEPIDQYVFIHCVDGTGWYSVNGQRHRVEAGQYFILPAGLPHAYGAGNSAWSIYWMHFKGTMAPLYAAHALTPQTLLPGTASRMEVRTRLFEEIYRHLDEALAPDCLGYATTMLHRFFGSLVFLTAYRADHPTTETTPVRRAVHFMKENMERQLTANDIAQFAGCTRSVLLHHFQKELHMTPITYLTQLKINYACWLLDNTTLKVNQICHKVGIADPYYFSRVFSRATGLAPLAYRRRKGDTNTNG